MRLGEIKKLIEGTADAAFVIDPNGFVAAWNKAAAELFGIDKKQAIGQACSDILHGVDECGRACDGDCSIRRKARNHQPLKSYDIQVTTNGKRQWCNISVMIVDEPQSTMPYTIHIARPTDLQKRFEMLMRDFVVNETNLPVANVSEILAVKNTPTNVTELSRRELEILRCLAKGATTKEIADQLYISRTTVNNHIQHILKKLDAHTRLEAVRRAEQARLI
ncbi:MAG: PAS and helix-turn-helix domain-containing protein [Acidobacteria bacterium]|nr:PAS and helix-turn-helix domain-containing protein [Acidobacteriota bacterium]